MRFSLPISSPESRGVRVSPELQGVRRHAVFSAWGGLCVLVFGGRLGAEPPPGHYDGVDPSGATVLRDYLNALIR